MSFSLTATARQYPQHPYAEIAKKILGASYELSLAFVGTTRAKQLNITYRDKDYIPNVLSFPLDSNVGEIIICPQVARRQAAQRGVPYADFVGYLFIHGCLHLKGHPHGATMDKLERRYCTQFGFRIFKAGE